MSVDNKYVIINSVGKAGDSSATAEILVNDENASSGGGAIIPPNDYSSMEGFNYAILSGGTFDFSGCGTISSPEGQSLFHSNDKMLLRGNVDVLIDLSTSSTIKTRGNTSIEGTLTEQAPIVPIPDIDLTPYYNWALEHGEVHNGFTTTSDITPNGGILWVNGDFNISAHATIHGSIIATGDINLSGQIDIEPTTAAFSVVSRDGDIHVTSGGTITGLMYAKTGDLQHTANGKIVGQVIINGNIKKAGNSDIMSGYSQCIPVPPGSLDGTAPTTAWPVISAWQK